MWRDEISINASRHLLLERQINRTCSNYSNNELTFEGFEMGKYDDNIYIYIVKGRLFVNYLVTFYR